MTVAYLGPAGTFSEEALQACGERGGLPVASLRAAVVAVVEGVAQRALVPIENALEGSVDAVLDALAEHAAEVQIAGELVHPIRTCLVARSALALPDIELVLSHPQPLGQCAGFLRRELPGAATRPTASTADAVREVVGAGAPWAALSARSAAEAHGAVVLREAVDDDPANETRFVWVARAGDVTAPAEGVPARTTVAFSGQGDGTPGWLVTCLREFSRREVNLTRIESRPLRTRMGHYRFFADLAGAGGPVDDALRALATHCDDVRVLGRYPAAR